MSESSLPEQSAENVTILNRDTASLADLTAKRISALSTRLKEYKKAAGQASAISVWLDTVRQALRGIGELEQRVATLSQSWRAEAEKEFLQLEADLREACRRREWRVDGQWPSLYVERGVRVDIDATKRAATVGEQRLRGTAVLEIMNTLEEQIAALVPKSHSPQRFVEQLAKAYDQVAGAAAGPAPIWDVYRAVVMLVQPPRFWRDARSERFEGLSADQFRARLTHALELGVTGSPDGREVTLLPPLDPKDALFVYQPREGRFGFVGRIQLLRLGAESK